MTTQTVENLASKHDLEKKFLEERLSILQERNEKLISRENELQNDMRNSKEEFTLKEIGYKEQLSVKDRQLLDLSFLVKSMNEKIESLNSDIYILKSKLCIS